MKNGELKNKKTISDLDKEYSIEKKGLNFVSEELKQRLIAITARLKKYDDRNKQYRQNMLFQSNQKKLFEEIDGIERDNDINPDANESQQFWSNIWDNPVHHNEEAEWLKDVEKEMENIEQQNNIQITVSSITKKLKSTPNWKSPGPDGVQGYWLKNLTSLHQRIALQLDFCLQQGSVPVWMTTGKTVLCVKDVSKGSLVSNFRSITCLPLLWKLLTGVMADSIYDHLDKENILPNEQKGCIRGTRGTKDQLIIDKMIIKNCKRRKTNLAMAWIDYKKAFDMVPHSWILKCINLCKVAKNAEKLITESMSGWQTELTSNGKNLGNVKIKRGIFQGDSLSPLLFVITLIPLTLVLRRVKMSYSLGKNGESINHLLFMDDLKLYAMSESQIDSLIQTVRIFSGDINMEFGLTKCAVIILRRGKPIEFRGIPMPDNQMLPSLDKDDNYKYLGILEADNIKHQTIKDLL